MNTRWLLLERKHLVQLGPKAVLAVFRAAPAHGEVAQSAMTGIEMAVVHEIAGRVDRARFNFEARALLPFAPHHGKTLAFGDADDRARTMAMKLAAAASGKFLNMAAVGRARQTEAHDLHALAFHLVVVEREFIHVWHQIALPGADREFFVLVEKLPIRAEAIAELKRIAKNKIFVVKQVDDMRRVGSGEKTHRLVGGVEVLVRHV